MHLYGRGVESRARQPLRVQESYDSTYYVYETRPSETTPQFPASRLKPMPAVVQKLKMFNLYRYRGCRGGSWRRELGVDVGKVFSGESRDGESTIPVIFSIRGDVSSSTGARDIKNLVPIPKRNQNPVSRTVSEFAVPKFLLLAHANSCARLILMLFRLAHQQCL